MSDLDTQSMEQVRDKVAEVIELVAGVLGRVDEVLAKVEISNRRMFADLQAQTKAGFASLRVANQRAIASSF